MAYEVVPERNGTQQASSADTNQLQKNISAILEGLAPFSEIATPPTPATNKWVVYFKSDGKFYKKSDAGVETEIGAGGASGYSLRIEFPAGSMNREGETNPADLQTLVGTDQRRKIEYFDATTEEFLWTDFKIPSWVTGTTAYFYWTGIRSDGATGDFVMKVRTVGITSGDDWDGSLNAVTSGALTPTGDGKEDEFSSSETLSTLGWVVGKKAFLRLSRDPDNVLDDLNGDWGLTGFAIEIPA